MKQYKGWELVKGIEEGSIKKGDKFAFIDSMNINNEIECDGECMKYASGVTAGFFSLANGYTFTKVQKPMNFFEAMAKVNEGEKVTNDYLKDKDGNYTGYYFKEDNKLYYYIQGNNTGEVLEIRKYEIISNWYICEE